MTAALQHSEASESIVAGVDSHADTHHVVVVDSNGHRIADHAFPATSGGYHALLAWLERIRLIGVESTGAYAAGMTRLLTAHRVPVVEGEHPHAHTRSRVGKDDVVDADAAARKALSGEPRQLPRTPRVRSNRSKP